MFKFNKRQYIVFLIILLIFSTLFSFFKKNKNYRENFTQNTIEMVVSRYNEKLEWIKEEPFSQNSYIVYNKGANDDFYKSDKLKETVKIENVGRESHTYLYHIINNYDELADMTIFLPGSVELPHKYSRSKELIEYVNNNQTSVLSCSKDHIGNVYDLFKDFEMNDYPTTSDENKTINSDSVVGLSPIRPFGKWYKTIFGEDADSKCFVINAIFAVSKKDIKKKPKSYYEDLIKHLDSHKNPEAGHYFERSWENVFGPMDNVKYL